MFVPHGADDERATEADGAQRPAEEALAEELRAEFADHVASARERLEQQGVAAGDAQRRALDQFGDVAAVVRRCWWIRKGEEMMNRAISITLLVVLIAGLASLGVAGWQVQRAVGGRMDRLSEQLASLAETQQSLLAQQAQTLPVRIRGRLYLGDPSKPAAKAKLWIYRFTPGSEMNRLRRVETDAQGNFNSGPLPPGAYFVAAPLCDREANASDAGDGIQSRPLYLYEGNETVEVDLDVLARSEIRVAFVRPVPDQIEEGDQSVEMQVGLTLIRAGYGGLPWNPELTPPTFAGWPLVGAGLSSGRGDRQPSRFPVQLAVPEGKYLVWIMVGSRPPGLGGAFRLSGKLDNLDVAKGESVEIRVDFPSSVVEELHAALKNRAAPGEFEKLMQAHQLKLEVVRAAAR